MDETTKAVIDEIIKLSVVRPDGQRVFYGTPRPLMEKHGVSSGARYRTLYNLGFRRQGRGRRAEWIVPNMDNKKKKAEDK